jgi:hypothetical protein
MAGPMTAPPGLTMSPHMPMTLSPGFGMSGGHGGARPPAVMPRQSALRRMRSPPAGAARQPAIVGRPQIMRAPGAVPRNTGSAAASSLFLNSGIGIIPTPPPSPTPPAEIAAPVPELAPIAPLSPQLQTQFSTGGVVQPNMALSPGGSSTSTPGGGGESLADCMGFWDRETHMTKAEWKTACTRTMEDYPNISRPG